MDCMTELAELQGEAVSEGYPLPSHAILDCAKEALVISSEYAVSEPSIIHDDEGGVELFFNERRAALLIALRADAVLQVFGDSDRERWRARYSLSGEAWKRHLALYIAELADGRA
jgi:hypothetical protein